MTVLLADEFRSIMKREMTAQGIGVRELARRLDVSPAMVSRYLNGKTQPGLDVAERFLLAVELRPHLQVGPESRSSVA